MEYSEVTQSYHSVYFSICQSHTNNLASAKKIDVQIQIRSHNQYDQSDDDGINLVLYRKPSQCGATAECRTRDREIPDSKLDVPSGFLLRQGN